MYPDGVVAPPEGSSIQCDVGVEFKGVSWS